MKPSLPKGTRDFGPSEVIKRQYIFDTIKEVFKKYAFMPIETPVMESLDTLTGKYGEEGDKLLFKVLNNGDYLAKSDKNALAQLDSAKLTSSISKRGLRYDLTVPFARFVVMNQNDIQLPFKRYQIQPVWRADRPQKGRYQEFYQCDVDVVGSESLMYEAELVSIYAEVFAKLGISTTIMVNNRKVLYGIAEQAGVVDHFIDMTVAIDKLDKIGVEGVKTEMVSRGISESAAEQIFKMLEVSTIDDLKHHFTNTETGLKGIVELQTFHKYLDIDPVDNVKFEITLARGLGYYTGCIFEVKVDTNVHSNVKMGSIGGGGRYGNLTGTFGLKGVSGVGISFGAERIYDVMEELEIFPNNLPLNPDLLLVTFSEADHLYAYKVAQSLRKEGLMIEVYPDFGSMKKQMKYANNRNIMTVGIIGDDEITTGTVMVKNLETGEQTKLDVSGLAAYLKKQQP